MISPTLDATGETGVAYDRWYDNTFGDNPMADIFEVEISDDDGATWVVAEAGADIRYRAVWAAGSSHAWVVGEAGTIRATTDAGVSWSSQTSGTGSDLKGVHFLDTQEGWVVGQNSTVRYTDDGGASWTPRATGIAVGLESVFFVDSLTGWAVGNVGTIYHTVSGGLAWLPEASGTAIELSDVFFADASRGWSAGDLGTMIARTDLTSAPHDGVPAAQTILDLSAHPNPFNPRTSLRFELPATAEVHLEIFDLRGRQVRSLLAGETRSTGAHIVDWNGIGNTGRALPSGVYVARLRAAALTDNIKLALTQ